MMLRTNLISPILLLLLLTGGAKAAGCQEPPRLTVVDLTTFLPDSGDAGIESRVWADGDEIGRTDPNGRCSFHTDPCSSAEWIEVKPTSPNYCPEARLCARGEMPIEIVPGCSIVTALEDGEASHIPWAGDLLVAVSGKIAADFGFDENGQIADLSLVARDFYAEAQFLDTARVARDLTLVLLERGEEVAAQSSAVLQLDAAFRAAGLEPAGAGTPLLTIADVSGNFVPTTIGQQVLAFLDPELDLVSDGPVLLTEVAFATLEGLAADAKPILHPNAVGNLKDYLTLR